MPLHTHTSIHKHTQPWSPCPCASRQTGCVRRRQVGERQRHSSRGLTEGQRWQRATTCWRESCSASLRTNASVSVEVNTTGWGLTHDVATTHTHTTHTHTHTSSFWLSCPFTLKMTVFHEAQLCSPESGCVHVLPVFVWVNYSAFLGNVVSLLSTIFWLSLCCFIYNHH